MQPNRLCLCTRTLVLLITFGLVSQSLYAQTFKGRSSLIDTPYCFEASMYPVISRTSTIRVSINNTTSGQVRIMIRNANGAKVYDHYVDGVNYGEYLDLSPMSAGDYIIDISKGDTHFIQEFTIYPPIRGKIALKPIPQTLDSAKANALTVN